MASVLLDTCVWGGALQELIALGYSLAQPLAFALDQIAGRFG